VEKKSLPNLGVKALSNAPKVTLKTKKIMWHLSTGKKKAAKEYPIRSKKEKTEQAKNARKQILTFL